MLYRIDTFSVPEAARREFTRRSRATMDLLRSQPGFIRSDWFEKVSGPGSADIITLVEWQDQESVDLAGKAVRAMHSAVGFDAAAFGREHGIVESKALYMAETPESAVR